MSSVLRSRAGVVLAAALFLAVGSARPAQALTACTAADITAQDAGCPASGACSITHSFTVGASCVLDFTGRAVTVSASGVLDVGAPALPRGRRGPSPLSGASPAQRPRCRGTGGDPRPGSADTCKRWAISVPATLPALHSTTTSIARPCHVPTEGVIIAM